MSPALAKAAPQAQNAPPRRVSQPHEPDERDAERMAEVVAGGGSVAGWSFSSLPTAPPDASGAAPVRRCTGSATCLCDACAGRVDAVTADPGAALDAPVRRFMEEGFGHDFGGVRLHADSEAETSARALGARAYAVGDHVVSAEGKPTLESEPSRRLIAHELAHVVQDRQAGQVSLVRRQAAPAPAAPAAARPQREERFGIGRGGSRLDAELDRSIGWLTAKMKVKFNFVDTPQVWPSEARKLAWRDAFINAVTSRWSFKHYLVPDQTAPPGEPQQVAVRVQVLPVDADPHFTMNVGFTTTFQTSSVGDRTATMDELDIAQRSDIPQTPAEHEFGHMLGLPHIHCDNNSDECYGVTPEEQADIMGTGSFVSPRDYAVFAELMPYFTGINYRVSQQTFIPTPAAPTTGPTGGAGAGGTH